MLLEDHPLITIEYMVKTAVIITTFQPAFKMI
jgi:hypothetical protein